MFISIFLHLYTYKIYMYILNNGEYYNILRIPLYYYIFFHNMIFTDYIIFSAHICHALFLNLLLLYT